MSKATISYAVTACNESVELDRLLYQLLKYADLSDEVIVQTDSDNVTEEVLNVIEQYKTQFPEGSFKSISMPLNKDFAHFKNNLKSYCKKNYIFFIDADEYLSSPLIQHLKEVLEANPNIECIHVPRVNTVDGLTKEHVLKWKWQLNDKGYVNWPDYQTRICKNNDKIKWEGKVHERLCGCKIYTYLPDEDETWALFHPKDIERQEKQNSLYDTI